MCRVHRYPLLALVRGGGAAPAPGGGGRAAFGRLCVSVFEARFAPADDSSGGGGGSGGSVAGPRNAYARVSVGHFVHEAWQTRPGLRRAEPVWRESHVFDVFSPYATVKVGAAAAARAPCVMCVSGFVVVVWVDRSV